MQITQYFNIVLLNFYTNTVGWLEHHMLICPSKYLLHIECPGCGLQRSIIALLRGDVIQSFQIYPATIPVLVMFAYLTGHLIFNFKKGTRNLTFLFLFCSTIILINYIYKLVTNQIY